MTNVPEAKIFGVLSKTPDWRVKYKANPPMIAVATVYHQN